MTFEPTSLEHPCLKVSQLTVNYDKTPVLWDLTLTIPKGVLVGIIGPNGAGKSTFLKTILGLIKPISGRIEILGNSIRKNKKRVAYVPQRESVDWDFPITVLDLVLMGLYGKLGLCCYAGKREREQALKVLAKVEMDSYAHRQISQLSGGQQQRAFLARALIQDADVYFMDEPFAGVDITTSRIILSIFHELKTQGKTIFVVHHDLETVKNTFDWVIMLNMRLVVCGEVAKVFTPELVHRTFGKENILLDEATRLSQETFSGISTNSHMTDQ